MNRRELLRGLICAPLVVTTPGLLMPVKALPTPIEYAMYVKGLWIDGSAFDIGIEYGHSVADISSMDWFDTVARVDSVEFTNVDMQLKVMNQQRHFEQGRRYDSQRGQPMKLPMERMRPLQRPGQLASHYLSLGELRG